MTRARRLAGGLCVALASGACTQDWSRLEPLADAGVRPDDAAMNPAHLQNGRTYDQDRDFIAWDWPVEYASVVHRDGTSLPPSEGGTSCADTCTENVTLIRPGGRVHGWFANVATFNVQVAQGPDASLGTAVIEACGVVIGRVTLHTGTATMGFSNFPQPSTVSMSGECEWSVSAVGGNVPFRAVTVAYLAGALPTVDLRVDGSIGPRVLHAPAGYDVTWTSTGASACTASGSWNGPRALSGTTRYATSPPGSYQYTLTCINGAGMATDSISVVVN